MEDLSQITIAKSVGTKTKLPGGACVVPGSVSMTEANQTGDVNKVKKLLNRVLTVSNPLPLNGICDAHFVAAINQIQIELGMTPDGVISPGKTTITKLKLLASPATLNNISGPIARKGVYSISYKYDWSGSELDNYRMYLSVGQLNCDLSVGGRVLPTSEKHLMDVTCCDKKDLLTTDNDQDFLQLIANKNVWGQTSHCRMILTRDNVVVWKTPDVPLQCPTKPWEGDLTPTAIGAGDSGPDINYIGTGTAPFVGRYLYDIGGKMYFKYGSSLMTSNDFRGFDCISFVGSLYEIQPTRSNNAYANSPAMADTLGASAVSWTDTTDATLKITNGVGNGKSIKKYFENATRSATYLFWTGGHIRLISNKVVHEYASSANGYKSSNIGSYPSDTSSYHLYQLPTERQF